MNTPLTLTEVMNCLGATFLPDDAPNEGVPCWISPVEFLEDGAPATIDKDTQADMDIYLLMENHGTKLASKHDALAIYTVGWASPNNGDENDDLPPSIHPQRKRVALLCLVTKDGHFGSAMKMYDNPDMTDMMIENEGRGLLRDSAVAMWDNAK